MHALRDRLYAALSASFRNYLKHGARSSKKLIPLHQFLGDLMEEIWGAAYEVYHLGKGREINVKGKYYPKDVDIAVMYGSRPVFGIAVKFVTSNYAQNANNYFENMMGETANIQRAEVHYAQALFLRSPMPYLKRGGVVARMEKLSDHHLKKYVLLEQDQQYPHKPYATCLHLVNIDEEATVREEEFDYDAHGRLFSEMHQRHFSIESLVEKTLDYKLICEAGHGVAD